MSRASSLYATAAHCLWRRVQNSVEGCTPLSVENPFRKTVCNPLFHTSTPRRLPSNLSSSGSLQKIVQLVEFMAAVCKKVMMIFSGVTDTEVAATGHLQ